MKKKISKIKFKKTTIAVVNSSIINKIKGGSSLPTETTILSDEKTFEENCPTISL